MDGEWDYLAPPCVYTTLYLHYILLPSYDSPGQGFACPLRGDWRGCFTTSRETRFSPSRGEVPPLVPDLPLLYLVPTLRYIAYPSMSCLCLTTCPPQVFGGTHAGNPSGGRKIDMGELPKDVSQALHRDLRRATRAQEMKRWKEELELGTGVGLCIGVVDSGSRFQVSMSGGDQCDSRMSVVVSDLRRTERHWLR